MPFAQAIQQSEIRVKRVKHLSLCLPRRYGCQSVDSTTCRTRAPPMNEATKRKYTSTGAEKAAQFLMVMGEDRAAEVLKRLSSEEVQKIGLEMTRMNGMSTDEVNFVLSDFLSECEVHGSINIVADEYTKNVLVQALGAEAAETVLERIMLGGNTRGLDSLRWMEPQLIAGIIQNEHPQIQAIVVSYLPPEQAKDVLTYLPENIIVELLIRMAEMESV